MPKALVATALLLAVFLLATAGVLILAGPRGGEHGICDATNVSGGLIGDQPLEVRQRYERWEFRHEGIHGLPPSRACRLYGSTSTDGSAVLVAEEEYPGGGWYLVGLLIVTAPLILLGARRGLRVLQT